MTNWYKIKHILVWTQLVRPKIPATAISLDKSSIKLTTAGQTEQLTATLTPADSTSSVSWTSSDTSIATVSSTWLVTCVTPWTCTITATTDNGLTATCSVSNWWIPSSYTILYLPLNWDVKDPYNNVTYSWGHWSASYATWSWSTQAANFTGSNAISIWTSLDYTWWTWWYTVCFWFTTTSPSYEQRCSSRVSWKYFHMCRISSSKANAYCYNSNWDTSVSWTTTLSANTKYLFTATFQSGSMVKLYLNWQLENSASIWTFSSYSFQNWQWIGSWRTWDSEFWRWMIREFIVESKIWTADEVLAYYNQTK